MEKQALELLNTAKFQLIRDYEVFNVAFGIIKFIKNPIAAKRTLSIDRHFRIFYSPKFVVKLDVETLKWLLLHELLHITKQHYIDNISNYSKDIEINDDIIEILEHRISTGIRSEKEKLECVANFFRNHLLLPETFGFQRNLSRFQYEELLKQEFEKYLDKFIKDNNLDEDWNGKIDFDNEENENEEEEEDDENEEEEEEEDENEDEENENEEEEEEEDENEDEENENEDEEDEEDEECRKKKRGKGKKKRGKGKKKRGKGKKKRKAFLSFNEFVRKLIRQKLKNYIMIEHGSGANPDIPEWERQAGDPGELSLFEQIIFEEILKNIAKDAEKLAGHLPADLIRQAQEYFKPKINWSATLRRYLTSVKFIAGNNYSSFNRINRQFSSIKGYIKELDDYEIPGYFDRDVRLAIIIDTSGSIGDYELSLIFSELKGIIKSFNVKSPLIISCDVLPVVTSFNEALSGKFYGGGGTELHNAFELISKQNETFDCVITLTDGFTSNWDFKKPWNVNYSIVCLTPNHIDKINIPAWHKVIEIPEQFLKDKVSKKGEKV